MKAKLSNLKQIAGQTVLFNGERNTVYSCVDVTMYHHGGKSKLIIWIGNTCIANDSDKKKLFRFLGIPNEKRFSELHFTKVDWSAGYGCARCFLLSFVPDHLEFLKKN